MSNLREYIDNRFNPKRPSSAVISIKKNKNGMLDELIEWSSFLLDHYENPSVNQMIHHYINNIDHISVCPVCGRHRGLRNSKASITGKFYKDTCGNVKCDKDHRLNQTVKGVFKKYGVDNIGQTQEWRDKVKATNMRKRGVEWVTQSADFVKNKDVINKRRETFMSKYNKETYVETDEFKDKQVSTFLKNYGARHPMQNAEHFEERAYSTFKFKDYELPSGRIVKVQGYEPKALDILLEKYNESDLIIKDTNISEHIGSIAYNYENVNRRYYPDIYIKSENKIIEVKSKYTYDRDIEVNLLKKDACIGAGLDFEFMIL